MKAKILCCVIIVVLAQSAMAVSIAPEVIKQLQESGQLQSIVRADAAARQKGVWQPNAHPYNFGVTTDVDTLHCLIVLADFSDMTHESGFHAEPTDFDTLLFSMDVREPGSMTDYYDETSYHQAYLIGTVTQWYRMPQTYAYYVDGQRGFGNYPRNAQRLTEDAVTASDPDVDFSQFDNDANGWVDALFVVHAGPGYEDTGNLNYIHSHAWVTTYPMNVDGVRVYGYSMEPEETGSRRLVTIGVFCHEFGHVLGLPDLYDYDYDSDGVGSWSVMAGGSWGGGGAVPVHFDGWCKYALGWSAPAVLANNVQQEQIDAAEYSADSYQLFSLGTSGPEYFLVENRRQELFDVSLPGHGLLIYHVDENAPNNNDQTHYKVAVEQADGNFDLEHNRGADAGDPWPGTANHRTFDDFSEPNAWMYDWGPSEIAVGNISDSDSIMYADLSIMYTDPLYELLSLTFDDSLGNNNGQPEAGETCRLKFTAQNVRAVVNELTVVGSCTDPAIGFPDSTSIFGILPINEPFNNNADPIVFVVPDNYGSSFVEFSLRFVALGGQYQQVLSRRALVGLPDLMLVDDDNGARIDTFYSQALDSLNHPYLRWDISTQGVPTAMNQFPYAVWFTGSSRPDTMSIAKINAIIAYLNGGGRLFLSSQDVIEQLSARGNPDDFTLIHDYLKVAYLMRETDRHENGQPGTEFDSLHFLTSGSGGANNQTSQDAITMQDGGMELLRYGSGRTAGVGVIRNYAALTVGFGMEGINDLFPNQYDNRREFMQAALQFLSRPTGVADSDKPLPIPFTLSQNYPNPFNPATQIEFELPQASAVTLTVYNLMGQTVDRPVNSRLAAGRHVITWDGSVLPSGVYFYKLTTPDGSAVKRMLLIK